MTIARTQMNKQLKNVPEGNKGLKKLDKDVRNKMGFMAKGGMAAKGMAKGGAVMKAKGGAVMAKGGSVKMAGGGMAKGYNIGGAIDEIKNKKTAKGMAKGGAVKMAGGGMMAKGYKAGGMMAKGYKAGGMKAKGGTKGGATGGTKVTRADGIIKKGRTRGKIV